MSKRLLIISTMNGFVWGGSEELWYAAAEEALGQGYTVDVVVLRNEPVHAKLLALEKKTAVTYIPERTVVLPALWKRVLCKLTGKPLQLSETDRFSFLYERSYDLLFVSQGSSTDILNHPDLSRYLAKTTISYFIVCHLFTSDTFIADEQRTVLQLIFSRAKQLFFVSERNRHELERRLLYSLNEAVVVKNPVNLKQAGILPWPQTDTATMAVVARLDVNHKGHDLLLDVLRKPQWQLRNFKLRIYGTGPHEQYLQQLLQFYGLEDKVELMGHCSDVKTIWEHNQVLVLTSRTEGLPLTIIEAMLCGRAVITTDVGDSAVLIEEDTTGWVAESATINHVAAALEKAWAAKDRWKEAGAAAFEKAVAFIDPAPGKTLLQLMEDKIFTKTDTNINRK